jgi:hypothetical protein
MQQSRNHKNLTSSLPAKKRTLFVHFSIHVGDTRERLPPKSVPKSFPTNCLPKPAILTAKEYFTAMESRHTARCSDNGASPYQNNALMPVATPFTRIDTVLRRSYLPPVCTKPVDPCRLLLLITGEQINRDGRKIKVQTLILGCDLNRHRDAPAQL